MLDSHAEEHPGSGAPRVEPFGAAVPHRRTLVLALCGAVVVTCFGVWLCLLAWYSVDLPRMDQLDTPASQLRMHLEGTLGLRELAAQHNESRKLVPNLLSLSLFELRGFYDVRAELFLGWALCALIVAAMARLAWLTTRSAESTAIVCALASGLLWSSHTLYFHFFSVTFERLIPQLVLVALAGVFVRHGASWGVVALACLGCFVSQFSYASGVVLWPTMIGLVAFIDGGSLAERRGKLGAMALAAAVSSALYFHDYAHPPGHSGFGDILGERPVDMVKYVLLFVGNAVTSSHRWRAAILGGVVVVAFVALAARFAYAPPRGDERTARLAWIAVGLYSVAQALLTMVGRLPMGIGNATRPDYVTHPIYVVVAVVALALLSESVRLRRQVATVALVASIGLAVSVVMPSMWRHARKHERTYEYARACVLLASFHEEPACLDAVFPSEERRSTMIRLLSPLLRRPLLQELAFGPEATGEVLSWELGDGALRATGIATLEGAPADAIVVVRGDGPTARIVRIEPVGLRRPASPRDAEGRLEPTGWVVELALVGEPIDVCALRLHAMDNERGELREIPGGRDPGCSAVEDRAAERSRGGPAISG